jgi:hypothetical protein
LRSLGGVVEITYEENDGIKYFSKFFVVSRAA